MTTTKDALEAAKHAVGCVKRSCRQCDAAGVKITAALNQGEGAATRWARDRIQTLEQQLADARMQVDVLTGQIPTNVYWMDIDGSGPGSLPEKRYLPKDAWLVFEMGGHAVHVMYRDGGLDINSASGSLVVQPVAANRVTCYNRKMERAK